MKRKQQEDLKPYRIYGLPLLLFMLLLALAGVAFMFLLKWLF